MNAKLVVLLWIITGAAWMQAAPNANWERNVRELPPHGRLEVPSVAQKRVALAQPSWESVELGADPAVLLAEAPFVALPERETLPLITKAE